VAQRRGDLEERLEDEPSLVQPRVRDHEPRLFTLLVAEEEDVDVDQPRSVPSRAHSTHRALDVEARAQELLRQKLRPPGHDGVQVPALRHPTHGLGLPGGAPRIRPEPSAPELPHRLLKRSVPIAEVRAQAEEDIRVHYPLIIHARPVPGEGGVLSPYLQRARDRPVREERVCG